MATVIVVGMVDSLSTFLNNFVRTGVPTITASIQGLKTLKNSLDALVSASKNFSPAKWTDVGKKAVKLASDTWNQFIPTNVSAVRACI